MIWNTKADIQKGKQIKASARTKTHTVIIESAMPRDIFASHRLAKQLITEEGSYPELPWQRRRQVRRRTLCQVRGSLWLFLSVLFLLSSFFHPFFSLSLLWTSREGDVRQLTDSVLVVWASVVFTVVVVFSSRFIISQGGSTCSWILLVPTSPRGCSS